MGDFSRRQFMQHAAAVSAGFLGLQALTGRTLAGLVTETKAARGYGPLVPDPYRAFDLPQGFDYRVISQAGQVMDDGLLVPALPDGMAAFPGPDGKVILIRNHEVAAGIPRQGAFGWTNELLPRVKKNRLYDPGHGQTPSLGGTTTLVYDPKTQTVERQYLSLAGTQRNCAGGPTPWNSWVSCEETDNVRAGQDCEHDHGYNFEVPATTKMQLVKPVALKDMGRFRHEAIAVDPKSGVVFQTEDRDDGAIYRFIPNVPGKLQQGGRLQALIIATELSRDTRNWPETTPEGDVIKPGKAYHVDWVDITDVESPEDDLRHQARRKNAATFARGEGMWYGNGGVYFACTNGGREKLGQIWKYTPSPYEGHAEEKEIPGTLELFIEPNDHSLCQNADNITIAPWGDLIICEDGSGSDRLLGITPQGNAYLLGENKVSSGELCGCCFSPDGQTLFFNMQAEGLTIAITGPWQNRHA